jgi:type III secretion protein J
MTNDARGARPSQVARFASFLAVAALGGCSVPVAAGLDENDANQAVVALERYGIASEKERDPEKEAAYRVLVARDDASSAVGLLAQENLPPRATPGVLAALGQGSMVPSRLSEQAKLVTGTSGELERSLLSLDGVVSARVHLAVPPRDPLAIGQSPAPATASVLLRHRGATPPIAAGDVQRLVAGAVAGLAPEQVSVVLSLAPPLARPKERELSRVGPLTLARSSVNPLRVIIGAAVVLNIVLLGVVLVLWTRMRRTESLVGKTPVPAAKTRG